MGLGSSFKGLDYVGLESLLSDEEKMIRDTVRGWVTDEVLPVIEHHFRDGTFPNHLIPAVGELGLLGANLHGYGCAGLGAVAYGLIMQELERGDSGLRSFVSVQGGLVMYPIHEFGSEEQKTRWLPALRQRQGDRLLRAHRAGPRLRPRSDEDARRSRRAIVTS